MTSMRLVDWVFGGQLDSVNSWLTWSSTRGWRACMVGDWTWNIIGVVGRIDRSPRDRIAYEVFVWFYLSTASDNYENRCCKLIPMNFG